MGVSAHVDGLDGLVRDLTRAADRVRPEAGRVVVDHAGQLAQKMRDRVHIDSGATLESITSDDAPTMDGTGVSAEAGPEWFVGKYEEFGTSRMAPIPFAEPALAEQLPRFATAVGRLHDDLLP